MNTIIEIIRKRGVFVKVGKVVGRLVGHGNIEGDYCNLQAKPYQSLRVVSPIAIFGVRNFGNLGEQYPETRMADDYVYPQEVEKKLEIDGVYDLSDPFYLEGLRVRGLK